MLLRSVAAGLKSLLARTRRNGEISAEVRAFVDSSIDEKIRRGLTREQAVRDAHAELGSLESVRHKVWAAGWESLAESLAADIRSGMRQILRSPGLSLVAICSLALGIGANTAIFTLINDLLLKQLPVHDPGGLLAFGDGTSSGTMESSGPGPYDIFPYEFYRRLVANPDRHFDGLCAFSSFPTQVSVRTGSAGAATQANSHLVSGGFFSVLGVEPYLGRAFQQDDTASPGRNAVVVLSYRYWREALSADPAVLGRALTINGTAFTVVGVMPPRFYGVELNQQAPDMWLPITMQVQVTQRASLLGPDGMFWIHIMARRNPAVPVAQAQSWATVQFQRFLLDRPGATINDARRTAIRNTYIPLLPGGAGLSYLRSAYQVPLTVLMIMVGVVLLIACANLANLLLAKAAARQREFSARLALGSTRARIVRQVLVEALVLAFAGGALGLALAFWATRLLIHFIDGGAAHTALSALPDLHVLAFTSAICLLTGALFGAAPAWRSARNNAAGVLSANARTAGAASGHAGSGTRLLPRALIVAQVAFSLILLTVAGLLLRTFQNLQSQDLGFDRNHVLLVQTNPKFAGYSSERLNVLYDRLLTRIDGLPGVRSAALSGGPPMSHGTWGSPIFIDGRPTGPDEDVSALLNRVSAGYFETLGIPLLRGRTIGPQDTPTSTRAVVVNQTLANRYFPHGDAIGHTFRVADPAVTGTWQIVGIVRDAKYNSPAEQPAPFAYLAVPQLTGDDRYAYCLQIRTTGDPDQILGEVRAAFADIDPNLPILETRTLAEHVDSLLDRQMFISQLAGCFALLALALASIGLYGVMTYSVVLRTGEIGVRMALGAPRNSVLWMFFREALLLLGIGMGLGIPLSLAASRAIRAGLFGVSPTDPATLLAAALIIGAAILAGSCLPALRATRIDPMAALRCE